MLTGLTRQHKVTPEDLIRLAEGIIVLAGIAAVVYAVFKNQTVKQTIQSQKELIETLKVQVDELRTLHIDNEKAIAKLSGQLEVYKEIPLKEISKSLNSIDTGIKLLHDDHKVILKKNQSE